MIRDLLWTFVAVSGFFIVVGLIISVCNYRKERGK